MPLPQASSFQFYQKAGKNALSQGERPGDWDLTICSICVQGSLRIGVHTGGPRTEGLVPENRSWGRLVAAQIWAPFEFLSLIYEGYIWEMSWGRAEAEWLSSHVYNAD